MALSLDCTSADRTSIPPESALPASGPTRPSVAIVTDDESLAAVCTRVLEKAGYAVLPARHSGHALLACIRGEHIDVLVVELSMEDGSGPALMRRMRRYNTGLRALYLARPGLACSADNLLVRPFTRDDLLSRLSALAAPDPGAAGPARP